MIEDEAEVDPIVELHRKIEFAVNQLESEKSMLPQSSHPGEYPMPALVSITHLSSGLLSSILSSNYVIATANGYDIDRVIQALNSYLNVEENQIQGSEEMIAA